MHLDRFLPEDLFDNLPATPVSRVEVQPLTNTSSRNYSLIESMREIATAILEAQFPYDDIAADLNDLFEHSTSLELANPEANEAAAWVSPKTRAEFSLKSPENASLLKLVMLSHNRLYLRTSGISLTELVKLVADIHRAATVFLSHFEKTAS